MRNYVASRAFHSCLVERVERFEPVELVMSSRAVRQAWQPKCMDSTRRTCRVVSSRDVTSQVEIGLYKTRRVRVQIFT